MQGNTPQMLNAAWTATLPGSPAEAPALFPTNIFSRTGVQDATEGALLASGKQQRLMCLWLEAPRERKVPAHF